MSRRISSGNDAQLVVLRSVSVYFEGIREIPAENLTLKETIDAMKAHVPDALNGLSRERLDAVTQQMLELAEATLQYEDEDALNGMNVHQAAALRLYTADYLRETTQFYSLVNLHLRTRHALTAFVPFIWLLLHALKKCPVFPGTHVYRGINIEGEELTRLLSRYRPNMRHHWYGFTSTSAIVSVQERFLGENVLVDQNGREHRFKKGVMFHIQLRPGARVISKYSDYPDEEEILLPPNFTFEVVDSSSPNAGLHILQLRELEPDEVLLDLNATQPGQVGDSQEVALETSHQNLALPEFSQVHSNEIKSVENHQTTAAVATQPKPLQLRFQRLPVINEKSLFEASTKGSLEEVEYLVRNGVNVNCKDTDGYTPLHWCERKGHMEVVNYLLQHGADANCKNNVGETPLHISAQLGYLEVVKYQLQQGADKTIRNWFGQTAYDVIYYGSEDVKRELRNLLRAN